MTWLSEQLRRHTYRPGWRFWIDEPFETRMSPGSSLNIRFDATDSTNPSRTVGVGATAPVPLLLTMERDPEMFTHWVGDAIRTAEMHEMDEWFRRDGRLVDDPHARR